MDTNLIAALGVGALLATGGALLIPDGGTQALKEPVIQEPAQTYFAEIEADGTVLRVIVADQAFIDSGVVGDPATWVQTDYKGGVRKNYPSKGDSYNRQIDAFVPQKRSAEAVLDPVTATWIVPTVATTTI